MKKMYIIIGGILLLTSSAFAIWKISSKKSESSPAKSVSVTEQIGNNQKEESNNEKNKFPMTVKIKSKTHSENWEASPKNKAIDIKIDYIEIENKDKLKEIDNLNDSQKKEAEERYNKVKKELQENLKNYKQNGNIDYEMCFTCLDKSEIVKNNENGIISVSSVNSWFAGGTNTISHDSFVLDCNTGKKLSIFDVIKGDEMKIREMIGKEIDKSDWAKEIRKNEANNGVVEGPYFSDTFTILGFGDNGDALYNLKNQPFHLKNKSIIIDFNSYDLGAGAYGAPSFEISYDTIKKYGLSVDNKFD